MTQTSKSSIPIILLEDYVAQGMDIYYPWEPQLAPHVAIIGGTGSGKSYFATTLLGKICKHLPDAELHVADFKGDDNFLFLEGSKNFYRFQDCYRGVDEFYQRFQERQNGTDKARTPLFLFFDELASAVIFLSKKESEEFKNKIATLLMLGRSFSVFLIIAMQRPDANHLPARDNINLVIALGNLSKEAQDMFFHNFKNEMSADRKRGSGYMLECGICLYKVISPTVRNPEKLQEVIRNTLNKPKQRSETELLC